MRILKENDRIPQGCIERFIPSHVLKDTVFSDMGIIIGGISFAQEGFVITRPGKRKYHICIMTISGNGEFIMEDNSTIISGPGEIFFSNANGQGHIHKPKTIPWVVFWLRFDVDKNWLIPPFGNCGIISANNQNNAIKLSGILESILDEELYIHPEMHRLQRLYAELFMIYFQQLLSIQTGSTKRFDRYRNRLNKLWQAIITSPGEAWLLEDMCKFAGFSRAHLSRICELLYQKSPGEKVKEIKMEHALSLLQYFDYPVSEVAERVGYMNMSNFSTAFKKYFGYPPKDTVKMS